MLSWLSRDTTDHNGDDDNYSNRADVDCDAPETPAPVFAVKAFRHAIFGTPKADEDVQSRPPPRARKSTSEVHDAKEDKGENKRHSDEHARRSDHERHKRTDRPVSIGSSPARRPGILLTPGTGGKGKTVSFGSPSNKRDANEKAVKETKDCPAIPSKAKNSTTSTRNDLGHTFTEKLRQAGPQEETNKQRRTERSATKQDSADDVTLDMNAPRSASGQYWKTELGSYSTKSQVEMRKLFKKEQVAKRYAKLRDMAAVRLEEELEFEKQKVAKLEQQIEDLRAKLAKSRPEENITQEDREGLTPERGNISQRHHCADSSPKENNRADDRTRRRNQFRQSSTPTKNANTSGHRPARTLSTQNKLSTTIPKDQVSSDIWTGAAIDGSEIGAPHPLSESTKTAPMKRSVSDRSPLAPRNANVSTHEALCGSQDPQPMTKERRENARRRLEEKAKTRARDRSAA